MADDKRPIPEIRLSDGSRLESNELLYDILDAPALRQALRSEPGIEYIDDDFVWAERHCVIAALTIKGDRLHVQAMSRDRAERARELLERVAHDALRYRVSAIEDILSQL